MVARRRLAHVLVLALLAPFAAASLASAPVAAAQGERQAPQADDWQLDPRILPEEGFEVTSQATVDGRPARIDRTFDLEEGELTIAYTLGEGKAERHVEATLRLTGVYVFEDDGDGKLGLEDRVVEHRPVDREADAYVTPVRATTPLSSTRAVLPLQDGGRIVLTLTATPDVAVVRGDQLAPTETRLNLTVAGLSGTGDRHVALAAEAEAPHVEDAGSAVHLEGTGAGVHVERLAAIDARSDAGSATVLADQAEEGEGAILLLASPQSTVTAHDVEADVVHTNTGLEEVSQAVRGQAGPYLLGLLAASALVGAAAWRKIR